VDSAGVAAGVPVVVPEEVVLRTVSVRVSGLAWSFQTDFAPVETTSIYDLLKALFLVVQLVVLVRQ
jgi:hypothetical protein